MIFTIGAGFHRFARIRMGSAYQATTLAGGAIGYFLLGNSSIFWLHF